MDRRTPGPLVQEISRPLETETVAGEPVTLLPSTDRPLVLGQTPMISSLLGVLAF